MKASIYLFSLLTMFLAGTVSAEITINDDKTIEVSNETIFKIDDDLVTPSEFEQEAEGHLATVTVDDNSSSASEVNAENQIKGPVTSLDPFQVFGQDVVIDASTVLVNTTGSFNLGELLEVSGFFNTSNVFLASRVESKSTLLSWKLVGHVQQLAGSNVTLGQLTFDTSTTVVEDCGAGIAVGDLVKIKLVPIVNFSTTMVISDISKFECKNGLADIPGDSSGNFEFEVEGFVSEIIDADNFKINGQQVAVNNSTLYFNGTQADIVEGVKLEAEGNLNTATNILNANKIKFKNTKVRMEGPVAVNDLDSEQVTIMGITGIFTAFTEDKDDLLASGLSADMNIEARGYLDSSGNFFVEEFRERGNADASDVRLRGPIANLSAETFTILGVSINTTNAVFFIEEQATDSSTFFAAVSNGAIVDVNHGAYDQTTNSLSGGEVTLELPDDSPTVTKSSLSNLGMNSITGFAAVSSIDYGTITAFVAATGAPAPTPTPDPAPAPTPGSPESSGGGGGSTNVFYMLLLSLGLIKRKLS